MKRSYAYAVCLMMGALSCGGATRHDPGVAVQGQMADAPDASPSTIVDDGGMPEEAVAQGGGTQVPVAHREIRIIRVAPAVPLRPYGRLDGGP